MAIVQVSRITQRKGLATDLPQPLASAEIGWAVDQRRLFIGNGTLAEGAPVVGNTEILTEFSDILGFATQYIYKGEAAGYTVQTGATPGDPVSQSLQSRLDSFSVITDFGATGDGVTDVTDNINRAMFQLLCRSANPSARRSIFFPAGVYIITDTLNIPTNCELYGEGADSTIISFNVQNWTSTIAYSAGTLVFKANNPGSGYYRAQFNVPAGTDIGANNPSGDPYWAAEALPSYVIRTADSLQQTGVDIALNGAILPGNVQLSGMKIVTNQVHDCALIQNADGCIFDNVSFAGPLLEADLNTAVDNIAAVRWDSSSNTILSRNVTFNNCRFSGFTYATDTEQLIRGVTFCNCVFDTLHQGIVLGGAVPVLGGPTGVKIVHNTFDNIHSQGIVINNVNLNATAYNTFYDVGNAFNGYAFPATSIIRIAAENNVSVGDMFGRNTSQSTTFPRIDLSNSTSIALGMTIDSVEIYQNSVPSTTIANQLNLGTYQRTAGVRDIVIDDSTVGTLAVVDARFLRIPAFKFEYTILRNDFYRTGTMTVVSGRNGTAGVGFSYSDDYVENGDTGVTLEAVHNLSIPTPEITISYTASGVGDGVINYSITYLN